MSRTTLLVDFYWTRDKDPRIPLGHASILTAMRTQNLDVRSIVVAVNDGQLDVGQVVQSILDAVQGIPPSDVDLAFGAYVWGEELLQEVLRRVRAAGFEGRIILGGPQISYSQGGLEAIYPHADAFVRGYGEEAMVQLARTSERRAITGVHWAGPLDLVQQANIDLGSLPSPWLTGTIPLKDQKFIRWETQRGCQFRCAFCQHREAGARLKRRELDLPRIEAEIELFCKSDVRDIAVLDPIFNASPHATAILQRFKALSYTGRLSLQCRAELMDENFIDAASELDVRLEFGLQTIHSAEMTAIRRNNHMPKVDEAFAQTLQRGIDFEVSLIFGLPEQTLASFMESVEWCLERHVPVIKVFPLMLLRGTGLERDRAKWNLRDSGGAMPMVIGSASFDREEWRQMARISEALRLTEGAHPGTIEELVDIANTLEPDILRWAPEQQGRAA
ncbi:B12-binding domain-containing radical SAM protein [Lujinxingia vulgaris]|nr:B12-binding domain-containing radical SAM protein [Lujinxingia vulgaris]